MRVGARTWFTADAGAGSCCVAVVSLPASRWSSCATLPNALWQLHHGLPMLDVIARRSAQSARARKRHGRRVGQSRMNAVYLAAAQFAYQNPLFAPIWIAGFWSLLARNARCPAVRMRRHISAVRVIGRHDRTRLLLWKASIRRCSPRAALPSNAASGTASVDGLGTASLPLP